MITLAKYDFDYIYPLIGKGKSKITLSTDYGNFVVKTSSDRLECFKRNHKCVTCERKGFVFLLQSHRIGKRRWEINCLIDNCEWCAIHNDRQQVAGTLDVPHLNMYHVTKRGGLVLMTKDHIIPKSKGGPDNINNLQTMCTFCNSKKSHFSFEDFLASGCRNMQAKKTPPVDLE